MTEVTYPAYLLVIFDFCLIGALPLVFFRRGTFNLRWFLTASPFALAAAGVAGVWLGLVEPWGGDGRSGGVAAAGVVVGVVAAGASVYLIGLTMGAHRVPPALWHQDDDAPFEVVTWGPYTGVRHPFYTAFLAAFLAAVSVAPGPATLVPAVLGAVALGVTARREERRLLASRFGDVYAGYAAATGRFLPGIGRLRSPAQALEGAAR